MSVATFACLSPFGNLSDTVCTRCLQDCSRHKLLLDTQHGVILVHAGVILTLRECLLGFEAAQAHPSCPCIPRLCVLASVNGRMHERMGGRIGK